MNVTSHHTSPSATGGQDPLIVQDSSHRTDGTKKKATIATRKKFTARTLKPGETIFRDYKWTPPEQNEGAGGRTARGRKPYEWTPERSRQLIKLIVHTDLPFDDISKIMKDGDEEGPCESTCRNHWHDIFGYRPDEARLKNPEGRERRKTKLIRAFHASRDNTPRLSQSATSEAEYSNDSPAESSPAPSSTSSIQRIDSVVEPGQSAAGKQLHDSTMASHTGMNLVVTPPEDNSFGDPFQYIYPQSQYSRSRLPSLMEEGVLDNVDPKQELASPTSTTISETTVAQIEQKEDLPDGFINWFRRTSIGSSLFTDGRRQGSIATTRGPNTRPGRGSVATIHNMTSDAILRILENSDPRTMIQAGHIETLIQRGADVNAQNSKGETPLHLALRLGNIVVFSALLSHGANPNARTHAGEGIWSYGRKVSKETLDPNKKYDDKEQQRLDTMICAHIEFLKATGRFNPQLVTGKDEGKAKKAPAKYSSHSGQFKNPDGTPVENTKDYKYESKRRRSSGATTGSPAIPWSVSAYQLYGGKKQKKPQPSPEMVQITLNSNMRPDILRHANTTPATQSSPAQSSSHLGRSNSFASAFNLPWSKRHTISANTAPIPPASSNDMATDTSTTSGHDFYGSLQEADQIAPTGNEQQSWNQFADSLTTPTLPFDESLDPLSYGGQIFDFPDDMTLYGSRIGQPGYTAAPMIQQAPDMPAFHEPVYTQPISIPAETINAVGDFCLNPNFSGSTTSFHVEQPLPTNNIDQQSYWQERYKQLEQQMLEEARQRQQYFEEAEALRRQIAQQDQLLTHLMPVNWQPQPQPQPQPVAPQHHGSSASDDSSHWFPNAFSPTVANPPVFGMQ